jgi:hypothetical protein
LCALCSVLSKLGSYVTTIKWAVIAVLV